MLTDPFVFAPLEIGSGAASACLIWLLICAWVSALGLASFFLGCTALGGMAALPAAMDEDGIDSFAPREDYLILPLMLTT